MPSLLPRSGSQTAMLDVSPESSVNSSNSSHPSSSAVSAVIGTIVPLLALVYFSALFGLYRYAQRHPRPLNKTSGVRLQRYGPAVYIFMVCSSLAEVAVATWLLFQYRYNGNSPNTGTTSGVKTLLFSGCWTTLTAGAYTILFLHPTWSKYAISSIGAQAIWILLTWFIWVAGAAILNSALPRLIAGGSCMGLVYCGQIQSLFALSVLEILALTLGMLTIVWLAWQSTRDILGAASFR